MAERPLILFASYELAEKAKRHGGEPIFHKPSHVRQVERLQPKLIALQKALDKGKMAIAQTSDAIDPEYTLVLETAGDPRDFYTAIRNLSTEHDGVEWLFELVNEDIPNDEDFYKVNKAGNLVEDGTISCKFFCILANHQALSEILALWDNYSKDSAFKFPTGKTGLRNVFQTLKDIHLWGIKERLEETGILEAWNYDLQDPDLPNVKCEIELFFRKSESKRNQVQQKIESIVNELGGSILAKSCIEAIGYHAILVSIPREYAAEILNRKEVSLITTDQIMFIKPTGQAVVASSDESFEFENEYFKPEKIIDQPIIALFDGLPQEHHPLLENLLTIDDPDDFTSFYQIKDRLHGTSMASLITRGDLLSHSSIYARKLYVRPIMKPYPTFNGTHEFIPDDILIVDKIHEAVRRLYEPVAGQVAPSVKIINLSIGIGEKLFYNMISPLAKLLDWMSFQYRVLFIVSAGNHAEEIDLEMSFDEFTALDEDKKDIEIIKIINKKSRNQRLLSPAESMNSLTVGALFADNAVFTPNSRQLLPCSNEMPSPISSLGRGLNRSIKPDLLYNGGRSVLLADMRNLNIARWRNGISNYPPGILTAKPFEIANAGTKVGFSFGTSDSTAILTHDSLKCYEILNEIFRNEMGENIPAAYTALLLKAMLTHGAKWGNAADTIRKALNLSGRAADDLHKWLGYGIPDISRVEECTRNRITLIGYGELEKDSAHLYKLPLPFNFHTGKIFRSLTVTLAFFTPIKPTVQKYRSAQLWFTIEDGGKKLVPSRIDASDKAVTRGTLQHERFYGDSAVVWGEEDSLHIKVNCREDAGEFFETIPYALFATFEIAEEHNIDVYQRIIDKIKPKTLA